MFKMSSCDSGLLRILVTVFFLAALPVTGLIGCKGLTTNPDEIITAVQNDSISFKLSNGKVLTSEEQPRDMIPTSVIDHLAAHKVILIGESHQLREHFELMAQLIRQLHKQGLRQVLLEWPHAADWVLREYVTSGKHLEDWKPKKFMGGFMIDAVRTLNSTADADERIRIGTIDVNLDEYGGARDFTASLGFLADNLNDSSVLKNFVKNYPGEAIGQKNAVKQLFTDLTKQRAKFMTAWSEERYNTVIEMLEVETVSIDVRAFRNDRYDRSVKIREDRMKKLADLRLADVNGLTLINVGGNHAQLKYLKGTRQEWLGDYLANNSPVAAGQVYSVCVVPARGEPGTGGSISDYDILDASPPIEIFRLMNETWPDSYAFLPTTDSLFKERNVLVNFENRLYECKIGKIYDALLLLPVVHHEPPPNN